MKKQGFGTIEFLVIMIVILAIAVMLFQVIGKVSTKIGETRTESCSLSIIAAHESKTKALSKIVKPGEPFTSISCDREELEIDYIDIEKEDSIDQDKFNRIIADSLLDAWEAIGRGKYDPFSEWKKDRGHFQTLCIVWDTIKLDSKLKKLGEEGKLKFSFQTLSSLKIRNSRQSYSENIFFSTTLPPFINQEDINIKDGTVIVAKNYRGDLRMAFLEIHKIILFNFHRLIGVEECPECLGLWSLDIIPPDVSFSNEVEIEGRKYRICDQIKN